MTRMCDKIYLRGTLVFDFYVFFFNTFIIKGIIYALLKQNLKFAWDDGAMRISSSDQFIQMFDFT